MKAMSTRILVAAVVITIASVVTWRITGGDYYTKFEVVEEIETPVDADDPLAGTGFYENDIKKETVVRKEFRFGLLPTAGGLLDKHIMSVATIASPFWVLAFVALVLGRRRKK